MTYMTRVEAAVLTGTPLPSALLWALRRRREARVGGDQCVDRERKVEAVTRPA
jgi:hypothetical protein